jgi:hypothetical protein
MPWNFGLLGAIWDPFLSDYELISSQTLSSEQASVVFSNLETYSSEYKDLQIRVYYKGSSSESNEDQIISFNSDNAESNYFTFDRYARAFIPGTQSYPGIKYAKKLPNQLNSSISFGSAIIDIFDAYSNTTNKVVRSAWSAPDNESMGISSGLYLNLNPINTIEFKSLSGLSFSLSQGTKISIYGVRR